MPEGNDALFEMRQQVDAAYASAERLVRDAEAAAREHARDVPPRGFAGPSPAPGPSTTALEALQAILGLLEVVRRQVPPELAHQFAGALRDLLAAVRSLIDWYLERLDRPGGEDGGRDPGPREVEDIPID